MIAWLLATTLPLSTFPPRLVGVDPRYGPTCTAGQTVLNASTSIDAAMFTAGLQLRLVARHASEPDRAVQYAQTAMRHATMLNEQLRQTLAIPALVRADPPTLAHGDNLGRVFAALLPPQRAGIDAVRAYADEVQREPLLPHGAGWDRVQRARAALHAATAGDLLPFYVACGFRK